MDPLLIETQEQFKDFIHKFEEEIRLNSFQISIKQAQERYVQSSSNISTFWNSAKITWMRLNCDTVSGSIKRLVGDLKLYFSFYSPERVINEPKVANLLQKKHLFVVKKGHQIVADCKSLKPLIVKQSPGLFWGTAEQQLMSDFKQIYLNRFRQFKELLRDPLLEEDQFFSIVEEKFEEALPFLEKLQERYIAALESLKDLEPVVCDLEQKDYPERKIRQFLVNQELVMRGALKLSNTKERFLHRLKSSIVKGTEQEKRELNPIEEAKYEYLQRLCLNVNYELRQGLAENKILQHKQVRLVDPKLLLEVKRENHSFWRYTPWGRILIGSHDNSGYEFQQEVNKLKNAKYSFNQKLIVLRKKLVNINNNNPSKTGKEIIAFENCLKKNNLQLYQKFLDRIIEYLQKARFECRVIRDGIQKRTSEIAGKQDLKVYLQKLCWAELSLPSTISMSGKVPKGAYIQMLSEKLAGHDKPLVNQQILQYIKKYKVPLSKLEDKLNKEIEVLNHQNMLDREVTTGIDEKIGTLARHFDAIIVKYQRTYDNLQPTSMLDAISQHVTDILKRAVSFNQWSSKFTHPSEFYKRKDLADLGYNIFYDVQKIWSHLEVGPGETWQEPLRREVMAFIEWATEHPKAASTMIRDIAQLVVILFSNNNELQRAATTLKAKVFINAILGALGKPVEEKPDTENELRFRALADLVRHGPIAGRVLKTGYYMYKGFDKNNPITSLLWAAGQGLFRGMVDKSVRDIIDSIPDETSAEILQVLRMFANIFHGQAYMDSAVEKGKLEFLNRVSQRAQLLLRPNSLKTKLQQWWRVLSASRGKEKFIRLASQIGIISGGASATVPLSMWMYSFLGPIGLIPAAGISVFILVYSVYRAYKLNQTLNEIFPDTFETIRKIEAAQLFDKQLPEITKLMETNLSDLQKRGVLPEEKPFPEHLVHLKQSAGYLNSEKWQKEECLKLLEIYEKTEKENHQIMTPQVYMQIFSSQLLKPDLKANLIKKLRESYAATNTVQLLSEDDLKDLANKIINQAILHSVTHWLKDRLLKSYKEQFIHNYVNKQISPYKPANANPNLHDDPEALLESMLSREIHAMNSKLMLGLDEKIIHQIVRTYVA